MYLFYLIVNEYYHPIFDFMAREAILGTYRLPNKKVLAFKITFNNKNK
jgi:hypothetical protein